MISDRSQIHIAVKGIVLLESLTFTLKHVLYSHEQKTRVFLHCRRSVRYSNLTLNFNLVSLVLGWLTGLKSYSQNAVFSLLLLFSQCTFRSQGSQISGWNYDSNLNNADCFLLVPGTVTCSGRIKGIMRRWQRIIDMWVAYCVPFAWYIYSFSFWHLWLFPDTCWWHKVHCT